MKFKTKIPVLLLTLLAAVNLVFISFADCKGKCGRLRPVSCHAEKIQKSSASPCCRHTKPQPKKPSAEKCKGACCISNLPPSATTKYPNANLNIQIIPDICQRPVFIESEKKGVSLTNTPFYLHNSAQAILCVFVI